MLTYSIPLNVNRNCEPSRDRATQSEDANIVSPCKTFASSKAQAGTPNETWKLPAKVKRSPSTVPRSMTRVDTTESPQSSYYRWLDQNPQLAFQAANKLANSPAVEQVGAVFFLILFFSGGVGVGATFCCGHILDCNSCVNSVTGCEKENSRRKTLRCLGTFANGFERAEVLTWRFMY
jgi:hypothetical protein